MTFQDRKYDVINSSPLLYTLPDWAVQRKKPDGTVPSVFTFARQRRAIEFLADGAIEFNVFAPGAKTVEISGTEMTGWGQEKHALHEIGDGWWQAVISGIPAGIQFTYYFIDGVQTLYKYAPVCYAHSLVCNFLEVPDPNLDFYDFKDVPHGTVRCEYYDSSYTGTLRNCWVYTPPSYDYEPDKRYPVLYALHGGGENETGWFWQGKINFIADNLIAEGKCPEMIIVTNAGQAGSPDLTERPHLPGHIGELLVDDCIPFIDRRFRTLADKEHRALCGLSMGAYQTMEISWEHPEAFDWLGVFSAFLGQPYSVFLHPENIEEFNKQHKLLLFANGNQEWGAQLPDVLADMRSKGYKVEGFACDGLHEWQTWRWSAYDFMQRIFK